MHHISTGIQAGRLSNGRAACNSLSLPEIGNIGLLCMKHPYFQGKTSELLAKEIRFPPHPNGRFQHFVVFLLITDMYSTQAGERQDSTAYIIP